MHLLGLSAAVATLLQLAIALPTTDLESRAEANILAPTTVGLYLCVDADWKQPCVHLKNGPGLCSTRHTQCCTLQAYPLMCL